jgi:hypothetical protein
VRLEEEGEAALIGTVVAPEDVHNRVGSVTRRRVRGGRNSMVTESTRNGMSSLTICTAVCGERQPSRAWSAHRAARPPVLEVSERQGLSVGD